MMPGTCNVGGSQGQEEVEVSATRTSSEAKQGRASDKPEIYKVRGSSQLGSERDSMRQSHVSQGEEEEEESHLPDFSF